MGLLLMDDFYPVWLNPIFVGGVAAAIVTVVTLVLRFRQRGR
jgi:hypothetical protein